MGLACKVRGVLGAVTLLAVGCIEEHPDFVFADAATDTETMTTGSMSTGGPGSTSSHDQSTTGGPDFTTSGGSETGDCVPSSEVCNGEDDDCDEEIDEGCECIDGEMEACFSGDPSEEGVGACMAGTRSCQDGVWGACEGESLPTDELCNAIDDDCDGDTDEDFGQVTCGVGICMVVAESCVDGEENTCVPGEPLDVEECNGLDDDCDGDVDEIPCECLNGEQQDCYTGPRGTAGVGQCVTGTQTCADGVWGECLDAVTPVPETCDGLDNDCDGVEDNGDPGGGNGCLAPVPGLCSQGQTACVDGQVVCEQVVFPESELCDGFDNDCDTGIDEGNPGGGATCDTRLQGACQNGETLCQGGGLSCQQTVFAALETCNGIDDDCDGALDENNPDGGQTCDTGLQGACASGTTVCNSPSLDCEQTVFPTGEVCNGTDDDCDGEVDEGAVGGGQDCPTGLQGVCGTGVSDCTGGEPVCNQTVFPSTEICDGLDNDCDGMTDEGNPGGGGSCDTGQPGVCAPGTEVCSGGMIVCESNTPASSETCDGLDNDCDGTADDGNPGGGQSCDTGQQGVCQAGTTDCSGGMIVCNQNVASSSETCDGLDNDCDGTADENNPGGGLSCNTGLLGACAAGTTECLGGAINCNQNVLSSPETCNGIDDDCDGSTDEGNPGGGGDCDTGQAGVCADGTLTCSGGNLVCSPDVSPSPEVCDGLDNDCDSAIDDGDPGGGVACATGLQGVCGEGTTTCDGGGIVCEQNVMAGMEVCGDSLDNDCDGSTDEGCPCPNVVGDGTFEGGTPNVTWTEASVQFGTPLCTTAVCGPGGGSGPHGGTWWAWFGGYGAGEEQASVSQDITIPTGTATLTFWLEMPVCATMGTDTFFIFIDGAQVFYRDNTATECGTVGYVQHSIDVSAWADGGTHTLFLEGHTFGGNMEPTNFFVDDVALLACP